MDDKDKKEFARIDSFKRNIEADIANKEFEGIINSIDLEKIKVIAKMKSLNYMEYFNDEDIVGQPWWSDYKVQLKAAEEKVEETVAKYNETKSDEDYEAYSAAMKEKEELNRKIDSEVAEHRNFMKIEAENTLKEMREDTEDRIAKIDFEIQKLEKERSFIQKRILELSEQISEYEKMGTGDSEPCKKIRALCDARRHHFKIMCGRINKLQDDKLVLNKFIDLVKSVLEFEYIKNPYLENPYKTEEPQEESEKTKKSPKKPGDKDKDKDKTTPPQPQDTTGGTTPPQQPKEVEVGDGTEGVGLTMQSEIARIFRENGIPYTDEIIKHLIDKNSVTINGVEYRLGYSGADGKDHTDSPATTFTIYRIEKMRSRTKQQVQQKQPAGATKQPTQPTQPVQPAAGAAKQPAQPTQPVQPATGAAKQPAQPTQPVQPAAGAAKQPAQPTQPVQSATGAAKQPAQPTQPEQKPNEDTKKKDEADETKKVEGQDDKEDKKDPAKAKFDGPIIKVIRADINGVKLNGKYIKIIDDLKIDDEDEIKKSAIFGDDLFVEDLLFIKEYGDQTILKALMSWYVYNMTDENKEAIAVEFGNLLYKYADMLEGKEVKSDELSISYDLRPRFRDRIRKREEFRELKGRAFFARDYASYDAGWFTRAQFRLWQRGERKAVLAQQEEPKGIENHEPDEIKENNSKDLKIIDAIDNSKGNPNIENKEIPKIDNSIPIQIKNEHKYEDNIKKCRSAIISGKTLEHEGSVIVGKSLYATTSIGRARKNQEDAVLLVEHPLSPVFKMLVVADGMGGLERGEEASDLAIREIKTWFESLDPRLYDDVGKVQSLWREKLKEISDKINKEINGSGCTFTGAIIGKDKTIVANVGDSRAYAVTGEKGKRSLVQVTKDQSYVQKLVDEGKVDPKYARFHKDSNVIMNALGIERDYEPDFVELDNDSYRALVLTSDGVSDCLSYDQIKKTLISGDKEEMLKQLIERATSGKDSTQTKKVGDPDYVETIPKGKDNATAAMYIKDDDDKEIDD